jgi:hypothetical protein
MDCTEIARVFCYVQGHLFVRSGELFEGLFAEGMFL